MGNRNSQVKVKVTRAQLCHNDRDPVLFAKGCKVSDKRSPNMASFVGQIRRILSKEGQCISKHFTLIHTETDHIDFFF
jgi:hypothetical protein